MNVFRLPDYRITSRIAAVIFALGIVFSATPVLADTVSSSGAAVVSGASSFEQARAKYNFQDPLGGVTVPSLIGRLIAQVLPIVGALFLLMFIYSGVLWLTAGGDSKKIHEATKTMQNAVIGIAIVIFAYMIVSITLNLGTTVLNGGSSTNVK